MFFYLPNVLKEQSVQFTVVFQESPIVHRIQSRGTGRGGDGGGPPHCPVKGGGRAEAEVAHAPRQNDIINKKA